ncbi:MAG: polysaccharide biosynthesis protein [bacterium]
MGEASVRSAIEGKSVLVTGGTGSIGREIVRRVLEYGPKVVRVFSRNEFNQFKMAEEFGSHKNVRYLLGDVRDYDRVMRACEGVDAIFHAAALKHVPTCEYNPFEAVKTNVVGTQNLIEAAILHNVERLVAISTDKAVSPTNTMGATKLLAERLVLAANQYKGQRRSAFSVVRFGNVLASRGSVIPFFIRQIRSGGPVTLTHPKMRRFFMSIPDAVNLVLTSAAETKGNEIFILKMPVVIIEDLIAVLIDVFAPKFGRKVSSIKVETIGIRAGERIQEELMTAEEVAAASESDKFYVIPAQFTPPVQNGGPERLGYSTLSQGALSRDEIRAMIEEKDLIEQFLQLIED